MTADELLDQVRNALGALTADDLAALLRYLETHEADIARAGILLAAAERLDEYSAHMEEHD